MPYFFLTATQKKLAQVTFPLKLSKKGGGSVNTLHFYMRSFMEKEYQVLNHLQENTNNILRKISKFTGLSLGTVNLLQKNGP